MFVSVCVPHVEARDLRPEVPPEQSLVISSAHKASFLMLDVSAFVGYLVGPEGAEAGPDGWMPVSLNVTDHFPA